MPQAVYLNTRHNVIKGEFTRAGQTDWAVLCSRDGVSVILVYRSGDVDDVAELAGGKDRHYLQSGGASAYFSHAITVASREFIYAMNKAYDAGPLPPIDHDGINDAFVDKASTILYWHEGKWQHLQGAD